jgi:hypothetical protein
MRHVPATCLSVLLGILLSCGPCCAWLYDAGITQHLGADISNGAWIAAPFTVEADCYATSFGAAVARAFGPTGAGYDVYLTTTWIGLPGSAIAKLPQPVVPLTTQWVYYDGSLSQPVLLRAGTTYSLVLIPTTPSLRGSISYGNKPGTYYGWKSSDSGASWSQLAYPVCVRVDGFVPEPGGWMVLAAGLGCAMALARSCFVSRRAANRG